MHALAAGNPRDVMRLAQHLLDRGVVRLRDGAWVLPDRIDDADLPSSMALALAATVTALDPRARTLARALAQCPDESFSLEECRALGTEIDRAAAFRSLDRLLSAGVVTSREGRYALASR